MEFETDPIDIVYAPPGLDDLYSKLMKNTVRAAISDGMCELLSVPSGIEAAVFDEDEEELSHFETLKVDNDVIIYMSGGCVVDVYFGDVENIRVFVVDEDARDIGDDCVSVYRN